MADDSLWFSLCAQNEDATISISLPPQPIADPQGPHLADIVKGTDTVTNGHSGIGFLLNQATRALNGEFETALRHHGLRHLGLVIIRNTFREDAQFPDGVPVSHLSQKLIIAPIDLAEEVSALTQGGWITARVDGKEMYLSVTRKSENALPMLIDVCHWNFEHALNGFSREEVADFSEMLRRVIRNYHAYDGSTAPD
jgi:DNA-binding transcriptional ArsR family regulator